MSHECYNCRIDPATDLDEVEESLLLSLLATESLHGEAQTRLDVRYVTDRENRVITIDTDTLVGRDLARLFVGFLTREFGPAAFQVERAAATVTPAFTQN